MNDVIKVLESRRSCRNFGPEMIKEDLIEIAGKSEKVILLKDLSYSSCLVQLLTHCEGMQ